MQMSTVGKNLWDTIDKVMKNKLSVAVRSSAVNTVDGETTYRSVGRNREVNNGC